MGIDPHPVPIVKSEIGFSPVENRIDLQIQQSDFIHRHRRFTNPAEKFGSLLILPDQSCNLRVGRNRIERNQMVLDSDQAAVAEFQPGNSGILQSLAGLCNQHTVNGLAPASKHSMRMPPYNQRQLRHLFGQGRIQIDSQMSQADQQVATILESFIT